MSHQGREECRGVLARREEGGHSSPQKIKQSKLGKKQQRGGECVYEQQNEGNI
jgi:hypothetical protein